MRVLDATLGITKESFLLLKEMSPYLLFGFLFAGILRVFFSTEKIASHLGKENIISSLKASFLGIPLPLCSCGVIPAAISLRRQGANKGATLSFLISTPTTGIDSILATYALLGSVFTFFRIATTFFIAVLCGIVTNLLLNGTSRPAYNSSYSSNTCNICGKQDLHFHGISEKLRHMFYYAFVELLSDIGKWIIIGIIIGGLISYLIPDTLISKYMGSNLKSIFLMLLVGIPVYICATGSIPIVAALISKGMSPGAGLVFLIAGPATNTVTITVVLKELGKKALFVYLFFISFFSLLAGSVLNVIWPEVSVSYVTGSKMIPEWLKIASSLLLLGLIFFSSFYFMRSEHKNLT